MSRLIEAVRALVMRQFAKKIEQGVQDSLEGKGMKVDYRIIVGLKKFAWELAIVGLPLAIVMVEGWHIWWTVLLAAGLKGLLNWVKTTRAQESLLKKVL
jgi:hypothetical protein